MVKLETNGTVLFIELEPNPSAKALEALLRRGTVTLLMKDFAHMEKFGELDTALPRNDAYITAEPGDVMLSEGKLLVIYYASNTWYFTRLGKVVSCPGCGLKKTLGTETAPATLSLRNHHSEHKEERKMNILQETYTLSNGVKIPKLGLGTWFIQDDQAAEAVRSAVELGYRHIDTAEAYGNERGVGEGVRTCGLPREELFVTTKLAAEAKTYETAAAAIDESLKISGLDYFDLMLIHSPQPWADFRGGDYAEGNREAWRALEDAYKAGKLRAIGVSNFKEPNLENILTACTVAPMVNQLLVHVGNTPLALMDCCKEKGILVEGYSPVAHGEILNRPELAELARKYGVTTAQLCIRYDLQLGAVPLPKTANPAHMQENAAVDFEISDTDMEHLKALSLRDYGEYSVFPVFSGK